MKLKQLKPKTNKINIRLTDADHNHLQLKADEYHCSKSEYARQAILKWRPSVLDLEGESRRTND